MNDILSLSPVDEIVVVLESVSEKNAVGKSLGTVSEKFGGIGIGIRKIATGKKSRNRYQKNSRTSHKLNQMLIFRGIFYHLVVGFCVRNGVLLGVVHLSSRCCFHLQLDDRRLQQGNGEDQLDEQ